MRGETHVDEQHRCDDISFDDFTRRFALRANSLMWFLGAGASASAGVPTASDLIWKFKQELFVSQRGARRQAVADLGNPTVRNRLQAHVDSNGLLPERGSPSEYSALFESVYPVEADRRAFIEKQISKGKPSYGHMALGTLMKVERAQIVWTTNFDPLIADACALVLGGTGHLTSVDLDRPQLGEEAVSSQRWPVEIKLHGDFRSAQLKNTPGELREQDARLRTLLVETCKGRGLVAIGYSGRDESVMNSLATALKPGSFPSGLFWLHHGQARPDDSVVGLLRQAAEVGVEAALVQVASFDETLRDIVRVCDLADNDVSLGGFDTHHTRKTPARQPTGRLGGPTVRLNALQVAEYPHECRRVVCDIGGYSEIREALAKSKDDILFARVQSGVLLFGDDGAVRTTFDPYEISDFGLHVIDIKRLRYDSGERGLLREALARALGREAALDHVRRRSLDLLAPSDCASDRWSGLRNLVGRLNGHVGGHPELRWREGIGTRLGWADERLWLLVEPRIVFDGLSDENRTAASDFARSRTVQRYNRELHALVSYWISVIAGPADLRALGIATGVDARFRFVKEPVVSRRIGA